MIEILRVLAEHAALRNSAGVLDLSFRSRLMLTGVDRVRLLNGQVTNNVKDLPVSEGCYAALVTNKGRMQSDLNIYILPEEILLDFEPGLSTAIQERFDKFIIADDVQVEDLTGQLSILHVLGSERPATGPDSTITAADRFSILKRNVPSADAAAVKPRTKVQDDSTRWPI